MKLPKINIQELRKQQKENFKERLRFIDSYTKWLKKTSDKEWSAQQKDIVG